MLICALSSPWAARALSGTAAVVDFRGLGTFTTDFLDLGNLVVQAARTEINVSDLNGLGVVGGPFSEFLDGDEFLDFSFDIGCFVQVSYSVGLAGDPNVNGTTGDAHVEAFGCSDLPLGSVMVNGIGEKDLTTLFPGQRISRFRVTSDGDYQVITHVSYVTALMDVDGDGEVEALTDALLLLRYSFGFRGAMLVAGAVDLGHCTRCTAPQIESYVVTLQ